MSVPKKAGAPRKTRQPGAQLGDDVARGMILSGGAATFAELGLRATSVEDILKAANVSRRTFYRHYKGKEDVALELYKIGTRRLLEACKRAVAEETDPLRRFERFIDAHLTTASELSRLVFVLGGEAQRPESPLHARRVEVRKKIISLVEGSLRVRGKPIDPWVVRTLLLALEAVPRMLFEDADEGRKVTDAGIARARRVMTRVFSAVLFGEGPRVAPMPTHR